MANLIRKQGNQPAPTGAAWDPFEILSEMLRWEPLRDFGAVARRQEMWVPQFDVKESKDGYVFTADLPGIKDSDLDISLTGNRLTIGGKREMEEKNAGDTWYAVERSYGSFQRAFTLPDGVDGEKVHADLKEGVLTLFLPKRPEVQPRRIEVKARQKS